MSNSLYLSRYAYPTSYFDVKRDKETKIVIVIPCFKENSICATLDSLATCPVPEDCHVEVLVMINHSEDASAEIKSINEKSYHEVKSWISRQPKSQVHFQVQLADLPAKKAGVGLARKIAMDDALRIFHNIQHLGGIIVNLDADCTVAPNYLTALYAFHQNFPHNHGASIHFEHRLPAPNHPLYRGIIQYELFLRYYVRGLCFAAYPHAYHTIGSSMAVRADIYEKSGGMNTRKAGEDFYFIHKIIPYGKYTNLTTTTVYPSYRSSDRVPFGTGAALTKYLAGTQNLGESYHPQIFEKLKLFLAEMEKAIAESRPLSIEDKLIDAFLDEVSFSKKWEKLSQNSANKETLHQKFYHWFDGFQVLKFVHFATDNFYPKVALQDCVKWVLKDQNHTEIDLYAALLAMRRLDLNAKKS